MTFGIIKDSLPHFTGMDTFPPMPNLAAMTATRNPFRRFLPYSSNMTPEEMSRSEELNFLKKTVCRNNYIIIPMLQWIKELQVLGTTHSPLRYQMQEYESDLSWVLRNENAKLERQGSLCYQNLNRFREMACAVIMLRYAHHYDRESNIVKTALDLIARLQYKQEHIPPWRMFVESLREESVNFNTWYQWRHSPEFGKMPSWEQHLENRRNPMPMTDDMGEMVNLHWTAIEEFLTDYLNCPFEFEAVDDLLFDGKWQGASERIISDLWAMSSSIFPASLVHLRKEVERSITKAKNTYFKAIRSAMET